MVDTETLKNVLAQKKISNVNKTLVCLAAAPLEPKSIDQIRKIAVDHGLRSAQRWNISQNLASAKTYAINTKAGWELTRAGKERVAAVIAPHASSVVMTTVLGLRQHLPSIHNSATRSFVEEAIKCYEAKLYRAAIITSWVGAIAVLYDKILSSHLTLFNAEASKRDPKWRVAKTADDLSRIKEHDFLQILPALSFIGKNVKDELEGCLKLRNGCGHPNSLVVGEHKASAHLETLIQNVFSKF